MRYKIGDKVKTLFADVEGQVVEVLENSDNPYVVKIIDWFYHCSEDELELVEPTEGGLKFDDGKPPMSLLPFDALEEVAQVLAFGAKKYDAHNWRKGFDWSRLYSGVLRHLSAHMQGIDKDHETGLSHLAHAATGILFLVAHEKNGLGKDDRYKDE